METNASNQPQQTGGLKLMTVFIVVLALHVLVIGGITAYHLMGGNATDSDLTLDKTHKSVKASSDGDGSLPDASNPTTTATTTPATTNAPAATPEVAETTPAPTAQTPSGPVQAETPANPPVEPPTMVSSGPVKMPTIEMAPVQTPVNDAGGIAYSVRPHDTLAKIARRHHTTVAKLKAANGLNSDRLRIGQKLTLPGEGEAIATTATPDAATPTILDDSGPVMPKPTKHAKASHLAGNTASSGHKTYTVIKGDTLSKIARRFKTTAGAIMTANSLSRADKLSIGQKLRIPSAESRSATNAAPATPGEADEPKGKTTAQLANYVQ
jgi:LysM repeat protein